MAKRENGAGTEIKWLENKQLYCQRLGYKDRVGRYRVKAFYGKSKSEVIEKRKTWQKLFDAGIDVDASKITFGELLRKWLEVDKRKNVEITTYELYKSLIEKHIIPELGKIKLKDLDRIKLQEFINKKDDELSKKSLELLRTIIGNCLRNAVLDNMIIKNPAIGVKIPKKEVDGRGELKPFTKEELKAILKASEGKYIHNIIYVAAFSGMRKSELLALRWPDVDLKKGLINVRQGAKYSSTERKMVLGRLKTEKSFRTIPINDRVKAVLKKQKAWQAANKLKLAEIYSESDLIFTLETGDMIKGTQLTNAFCQVCKNANVEYRSFHQLRHTFASIAISQNVNIKTLSEILGHANIQITYNTYGHLLEGDAENVIEAVSNYLAGI